MTAVSEILVLKSTELTTAPISVDQRQREVTQYVAIFGNLDRQNEITHKGTFVESITNPRGRLRRGLVPVKHNHTTIVGKARHAEEDEIGLWLVEKFATDKTSDRIYNLMVEGMLPTASFKAAVPAGGYVAETRDGMKIRHLVLADLHEAGPVDPDLAVNPETYVVSIKALADFESGGYRAVQRISDSEVIVEKAGRMADPIEEILARRGQAVSVATLAKVIAGRMGRSV